MNNKMKTSVRKYTRESVIAIAAPCNTMMEFKNKNQSAYNAARRMRLLSIIRIGMKDGRIKWTKEKILAEARKYETPYAFQLGSKNAYQAAITMGILKEACSHMKRDCHEPYNKENLKVVVAKYDNLSDLRSRDPDAYAAILRLDLLVELTIDLKRERSLYTDEILIKKCKKYKHRIDLKEEDSNVYAACVNRGEDFLNKACKDMKPSNGSSRTEKKILNAVKELFPKTKQLKKRKIEILGKPHIKGFDIDIFIPELMKGIEFDGTYWHSPKGLKRSRKHWPEEDILNYHGIKDDYFASIGIEILHIKEENWIKDKVACIAEIENFLGITGFMSESELKAA
jgi:hypothetical protein